MKNTKTIISKASLFIVAIALVFVASYVSADYTEPLATAPACTAGNPGCDAPVNVGAVGQVKNGGLSVNAFAAYMNSWFEQNISVKGTIGGVTGTPAAPVAAPLSVSSDLKVTPLAGTGDRITCADANGQFKICGTQFYTSIDDIVDFTVQWNGSSWVLSTAQVLFTTNPAHTNGWNPITILSSVRNNVGDYSIDAVFDGSNHIDVTEIVSASIIAPSGKDYFTKLVLWDRTGNNRIEFTTSDDSSPNDISPGSKIKFIYVNPAVR